MALNPKTTSQVTTTPADLKNLRVTRTFGITAPSANSVVVGEVKRFTTYSEFISYVGIDEGLGNTAHLIADNIFNNVSKSVIYYTSCGTQALSATTGDTNAASVVDATTLVFAVNPGFTDGKYYSIDTGGVVEYRKLISGGGTTTMTINKLDFAHASGITVTEVTEYTGTLATCRTNLNKKQFEFYIEDSYGEGAAIETFLNAREAERKITFTDLGFDFGTTVASAVGVSQAINNGKVGYTHGFERDETSRRRVGVYISSKFLAQYATGRANVADVEPTSIYKTTYLTPVQGVTEAGNCEDFEDYLDSETATLTDGNVNNIISRRIGGAQSVAYNRPVTSYNLDGNGNPSTTFVDFHGYETVWYLNNYFVQAGIDFIQEQNTKKTNNAITIDKADVFLDRLQGELNTYTWFNRDTSIGGFDPVLTIDNSVSGTFAIQLEYKFAEVVYFFNYTFNIHNA